MNRTIGGRSEIHIVGSLQKGIAGGKFGLYSALAREDLILVPYDKSDAPVFFNCNSAEDLAYLSSLS